MKRIPINKNISTDEFYHILQTELNDIFRQRRQQDIRFDMIKNGNTIEIAEPRLYEGYLFKLVAKDNILEVHESEHYVDDVNALTINAILDELFVKHLGATAPQL